MAERNPLCPICERRMKVETRSQRFFGLPQRKNYECERCAVIATVSEVQRRRRFSKERAAMPHNINGNSVVLEIGRELWVLRSEPPGWGNAEASAWIENSMDREPELPWRSRAHSSSSAY